jgi:hypothetical protein
MMGGQQVSETSRSSRSTDSLRRLPKAEVHVHLEGCFEPATLEHWAGEAGVPMPRPRDRLFDFGGLADLLHFLDWACDLANTRDRLSRPTTSAGAFATMGPATRTLS